MKRSDGALFVAEPSSPRVSVACASGTAHELVAAVGDGCRVTALTKGQMSLLDVLEAGLVWTGPADVVMSFWTMSMPTVERWAWLMQERRVKRCTVIVDQSWPRRAPAHADALVERWGESALLLAWTHAKFAVLRGADRVLVVRTSANLNRNKRFETVDLDPSDDLAVFFETFAEDLRGMGANWKRDTSRLTKELAGSLGGGMSDAYPAPAMSGKEHLQAWRGRLGMDD